MLVELKNGETYNGHLVSCDGWMNICLREVICTSKDGTKFWRMPECYVRGNTIKYLKIPDEVIALVKEDQVQQRKEYQRQNPSGRGRASAPMAGGMGGRGRGQPPGRGGGGGGRGGYGPRGGRGGGRQ